MTNSSPDIKLKNPDTELEVLGVKLPFQDKSEFRKICQERGHIPSAVVRCLIEKYMENPEMV